MAQPSELTSAEPPHAAHVNMSAGSIEVIKTSEGDVLSALAEELESAARRIRKRLKNMSTSVIEIGRELRAAKQHLEHGHFLDWVTNACELSLRSAQLMMRAAEWAEGKYEIVAHLAPTTIYLLAAPSTPDTVRHEVLSRLEEGETPATQLVKEMIRAAKANKRTPREKDSQRECTGQQYGGRPTHPPPKSRQREQQQLQERPIAAEQAAATDELIKMLAAWSRFSDFITLLGKADVLRFVQALRDGVSWRDLGTSSQPSVTNQTHGLLGSPKAAADDATRECLGAAEEATAATPEEASDKTPAPEHLAAAKPTPAMGAPDRSASVSAEELAVIFNGLKPNTQRRGLQWVAGGCPIAIPSDEHFIITENLLPFRDAVSKASPTERKRFLDTAALQMTGRAEEAV
jgi:hypothetical protein